VIDFYSPHALCTGTFGDRIPIWYTIKLMLVAWLVLPQFRGAAFIYEKIVREKIRKYVPLREHKSVSGKGKIK